jgi:AraC-like DNA-binding protein
MVAGNLHALGFALLAISTLRDFYNRISRYNRIASQSADFVHYDEDGLSILAAENMAPSACDEAVDTWVSLMVKFMRALYEKELNPTWVELGHSMPGEHRQAFLEYFKCPVRFDCEEPARIAIDSSIMDVALPGASPDLAQHNDQIVREYLEKMDREDIVNRVRIQMVAHLSAGTLTALEVARRLHMSGCTMQTRLAQRGTNFQELLDTTRQELAAGYIQQSHLAITEIAYLLGFSDASNFTRAFRRWHGISPRDFRVQNNIEQA